MLNKNLFVTFVVVVVVFVKGKGKKKSCFSGEENKLQGKREEGAVIIGQNSKFPVLHNLIHSRGSNL